MLGVSPLLASAVLESLLKSCRSPWILHVATHGCFLPDQPFDPEVRGGRLRGPGMENPMLRSFLVTAGVNTWLRGGSLPVEAEDGIVPAEDVAGMNLLATELVVLSACQTGQGDIQIGEGVLGLRRAFHVAGAKTLVMSLWKVDDIATAWLMVRFYEYLIKGRGRAEALRQAQDDLRRVTVDMLREEWLSPTMIAHLAGGDEELEFDLLNLSNMAPNHCPFDAPRFWGAFILQGETGPLRTAIR